MLRDTFFRVQNYHQNVPTTGTWYATEEDNTFNIMKDGDVKATYTSLSRGFGKVKAVFNTEYIVFSKTKTSIYCIDDSGNEFSLFATTKEMSFVCTDNGHILIAEVNPEKTQLTVRAYIIVGNSVAPFLGLVSTRTINAAVSGILYGYMNAIKLDATSGIFCRAYEGSAWYSCKATKPAGNADDLVLEKIPGDYNYANVPVTGARVCINNNATVFYNPTLNYYCTIVFTGSAPGYNTSATITIYEIDGTQVFTNTFPLNGSGNGNVTARVYLDNSTGNGYITFAYSAGSTMFSQIYSITNWTITLIQMANAAAGSTPPGSSCGSGLFPLINNHIPPVLMYIGTAYRYKISYTTTGTSFGAPSNTDVTTFGSRVLWI